MNWHKMAATLMTCGALVVYAQAATAQTSGNLNEDLLYRSSFGRGEDVDHILKQGADPNAYGPMGDTPITLAMSRNNEEALEMVKVLLDNGADPNFPDRNGRYPLEMAIRHHKESIVRLLIDRGGDIHIKNQDGIPLYDVAARHGVEKITQIFRDKLQQEADYEKKMRDPARLVPLVQEFTSKACLMSYWNYFIVAKQDETRSEEAKRQLDQNKSDAEKIAGDIVKYFPKIEIANFTDFASQSINNTLNALGDINQRAAAGFGQEADANQKCVVISEAARASMEDALEKQRKYDEEVKALQQQ